MGPEALGAWIWAGSAFAGIGDSIVIGCVLYAGNIPIVPDDELWILARRSAVHCAIVPIDGIHIFIGDRDADMMPRPAWTAFELDMLAED
jgi:hypothetical protein